jgi:Domain of unknown function (DUF4381)
MSDRVCFIRGVLAAGFIATLLGGIPVGHEVAHGANASQAATPRASADPQATAGPPGSSASQAPTDPGAAATAPTSPATPAVPPSNAVGPSEPAEDIRDIRGPKYVLPPWLIPALVAAAIVLAFGVYGVVRWRRRRRRPRALLPFEIALQRLEEIRTLMQPASAREFSIAVSDIVRRYIEQRFDVTATHRTTEEFLHDLLESSNPSLARHRGLLSEFLHQCDLVKFAGLSLSTQSMESLHQSARAFVLETAKPEVTETQPPPSSLGQTSLGQTSAGQTSTRPTPINQSFAGQTSEPSSVNKEARDSLPST